MGPHISPVAPTRSHLPLLPQLGIGLGRNRFIIPVRLYLILLRLVSVQLCLLADTLQLCLTSLDAVILINVSVDRLTLHVALLLLLVLLEAFVYLLLYVFALLLGSLLAQGML
jgi:hypothetical protein